MTFRYEWSYPSVGSSLRSLTSILYGYSLRASSLLNPRASPPRLTIQACSYQHLIRLLFPGSTRRVSLRVSSASTILEFPHRSFPPRLTIQACSYQHLIRLLFTGSTIESPLRQYPSLHPTSNHSKINHTGYSYQHPIRLLFTLSTLRVSLRVYSTSTISMFPHRVSPPRLTIQDTPTSIPYDYYFWALLFESPLRSSSRIGESLLFHLVPS